MYIQPIYNSVNMCGSEKKPGFWKRIKQKALDAIPRATFEDKGRRVDIWKRANDDLSHPAKNRLIMGTTALLTQPAIDYYNHNVDEETREVSRIRTIAKILAGTTVGIVVRGSCHRLVESMTDLNGMGKYSKSLLPKDYIDKFKLNTTLLKNYRSTLSTGLAILAMCFTNFAVDAPLTVLLTNYFNEKRQEKVLKGGSDNE